MIEGHIKKVIQIDKWLRQKKISIFYAFID